MKFLLEFRSFIETCNVAEGGRELVKRARIKFSAEFIGIKGNQCAGQCTQ